VTVQIGEVKKLLQRGVALYMCNSLHHPVPGVAVLLLLGAFARCSPRSVMVERTLTTFYEDKKEDKEHKRISALYTALKADPFFLREDTAADTLFKSLLPKNPVAGSVLPPGRIPLPPPTKQPTQPAGAGASLDVESAVRIAMQPLSRHIEQRLAQLAAIIKTATATPSSEAEERQIVVAQSLQQQSFPQPQLQQREELRQWLQKREADLDTMDDAQVRDLFLFVQQYPPRKRRRAEAEI
jgi:hypothetical protein